MSSQGGKWVNEILPKYEDWISKNFLFFMYLFISLFKVDNDKRDTVYQHTHKIAKG